MCKFSKSDKDKIGNCVIYIINHTDRLCKTKLLKLLYIMEEQMARCYGAPFLSVPYEVWCFGPVQKDIFVDLSNDGDFTLLNGYIAKTGDEDRPYKALRQFDDGEFSDDEMEMMDSVLRKYGHKSGSQLVSMLHGKDTEWHRKAEAAGLLEAFKSGSTNNSDVEIDLSELLSGCDKERYLETLAVRHAARNLKLSRQHV